MALVEVVSTGSSFQSGECYISTCKWRDVTELIRTQCCSFLLSGMNEGLGVLAVGLLTGSTVILVRRPWCVLVGAFVDDETLWTTGVELQTDVCNLKSLT